MHTAHIVISSLIALVFVLAGLAKASGNPRGLAITREVNVKDGLARVIGALEAIAALGVVIGLRNGFVQWISLVFLWVDMSAAMYFHFKVEKIKSSFPPFFLLTLVSIALVTI
jgi:uncharacterized membrane protein YphA (DoxX/SURF4 family)